MSDPLDDRRKAAEESYFDKQNRAAIERLRRNASESRKSPITGKVMTQRVIDGITIDVCPDSGGIWLDAGELEALMEIAKKQALANPQNSSWLSKILRGS